MSAILTRFIASTFLSITALLTTRKMSGSNSKKKTLKNCILILFLIVLPAVTYQIKYNSLYTIIVYIMMIVTYKYILDISFSKSIIACFITILTLSLIDILSASFLINFITLDQIRSIWYINVIFNFLISLITYLVLSIKFINNILMNFIDKIDNSKITRILMFSVLSIVLIALLIYAISLDCKLNTIFSTNFLILIILFLLLIILIGEKNDYDQLSLEYDNLLNYVKVFEDWIENEQLNRHEFKNQLAVLRCMTKEKKIREKIDRIIADNINIDNTNIEKMKDLPNGGLKGLLYYKIALAKNKKLNVEIDINPQSCKTLNMLTLEQKKIVSKLLGIFCDNAIEAASETKKKLFAIEIYEFDNKVSIIISNTFNKSELLNNRYEKGVSSKGKGRGNGLYFANKLILRNSWIKQQQDTIDNLYIVRLTIKKK